MISIIGYIASIFTILSFTFKDIVKLRIVSSISCVLWIIYGIYKTDFPDFPVILVNFSVLSIHIFYLLKNKYGN